MKRGLFTSPEVCAKTGMTFRQLDYLVRTGIVNPIHGASGSGTRRRYSLSDLWVLDVLAVLYRMGFRGESARDVGFQLYELVDQIGRDGGYLVVECLESNSGPGRANVVRYRCRVQKKPPTALKNPAWVIPTTRVSDLYDAHNGVSFSVAVVASPNG